MPGGLPFEHIVVIDFEFEFGGRAGERPRPVCMVAKDLCNGQAWRVWRGEFESRPPFPIDSDTLLVAYYASAELGCFKALGWPAPVYVLDLFSEFRARTNGLALPNGRSLLGALTFFGIDAIDVTEKKEMIALILSGGPWSAEDRAAILEYCASDVQALERLLPAMLPRLDLPRALLRGRFMKAAAAIEWAGTPIDTANLGLLRRYWTAIQDGLISEIDSDYGVYDGRSFRSERWQGWLAQRGMPWPMLDSGRLDLSDDTFRQMARTYPAVAPMRELRSSLSELRLNDLAVGSDGRNRTLLSAFRSTTGRCQPSNAKYIFGPSVWLRSLIQPPQGCGVAYLDWSQQEHGIAAALSDDHAMQAAYRSGDPYLEFAKQARAVPAGATKQTHGPTRELFKQCALAVAYGMEADSLARRIGQPPIVARDLLRAHRETYKRFWAWSDAAVDMAMLAGSIGTVFGWPVHAGDNANPRSLRNFPMQGNGSEMLRLAACFAAEQGIEVCALIHDAVLICAPTDRLDQDIERMQGAMAKASRIILDGFELRSDANVIRYPDRYRDPRGAVMWNRVMRQIARHETIKQEVA
jgi:hypothetical protein